MIVLVLLVAIVLLGIAALAIVGSGAIPLAEHSLLLMMMLNCDVPRWQRAQNAREGDRFTHGELYGLTVGPFDVGHAGSDLALKAQAED